MMKAVWGRLIVSASLAGSALLAGLVWWRVEREAGAVRGLELQGAVSYRTPLTFAAWLPAARDWTCDWGSVETIHWIHGQAGSATDVEPNLAPLTGLNSLQELLLDGLKLSEVGHWKHLTCLPRLRRLQLRRMRIPTTALIELVHTGSIEELQLFDCRLEPGALEPLSRLRGLQRLELDFSDVSVEDLRLLHWLPRLKTLSVSGLGLLDAQLNELQELLPGTAISDD